MSLGQQTTFYQMCSRKCGGTGHRTVAACSVPPEACSKGSAGPIPQVSQQVRSKSLSPITTLGAPSASSSSLCSSCPSAPRALPPLSLLGKTSKQPPSPLPPPPPPAPWALRPSRLRSWYLYPYTYLPHCGCLLVGFCPFYCKCLVGRH